jgi:hypothetical protein
MSGQVIHVHNYTDGPPAARSEIDALVAKSMKTVFSDADRKEMLKSLVADSAIVAGSAKRLKGGISLKSDSAESDQMVEMATMSPIGNSPAGEVQAALRGNASDYDIPSVSASDLGAVGTGVSPAYLAKCEQVLADPKADPEARQTAGEVVTKARLTAGVLGMAPVRKSTAADLPKLIGRLEDILKSGQPLKDQTKDEIGATITRYRLEQGVISGQVSKTVVSQLTSTAQDERDASNAEVRAAQTRPALSGHSAVSPDAQIRNIVGPGRPATLSDVQGMGSNKGYLVSGPQAGPSPAAVAATLEDELASKSTPERRRAEAGECLTYMRLAGLVAA